MKDAPPEALWITFGLSYRHKMKGHGKFRPKDDGRWLLCGHVHEKWAQRGKMINVGVDVRNFEPISIEQIAAIINAKPEGYPMPKWEALKADY